MQNQDQCFPIQIGKIAQAWLGSTETVRIAGITSSGLFLGLDRGHSIFISPRRYSGPVNLVLAEEDFAKIRWGREEKMTLECPAESIVFHSANGRVCMEIERVWEAPVRPDFTISDEMQRERLKKTASHIQLIKGGDGFSPLLKKALDNGAPGESIPENLSGVWTAIDLVRNALQTHQAETVITQSKKLIGHGRGLTPSGDDFFCGVLLMLNRWPEQFANQQALEQLNREIVRHAFQATTSVGASLLECATMGEADEQIILLADALMNEEIAFQQQAMRLARWGHSSGADTALGLIVAIQSIQKIKQRNQHDK